MSWENQNYSDYGQYNDYNQYNQQQYSPQPPQQQQQYGRRSPYAVPGDGGQSPYYPGPGGAPHGQHGYPATPGQDQWHQGGWQQQQQHQPPNNGQAPTVSN